ncbi:MAG: hypothetical protein H0T12_01985 [Actinobacteria bacterium]|nr:hypothetical protein [Actinomycetota bacterium]
MNAQEGAGEVVDHNVHGLVSIRMTSAPPVILNKLKRRLGPSMKPADDEPDIRVTFKDSLHTNGRMRYLGMNRAAYDDEHFYLLDDSGNKIRIDFRTLGHACEIHCERSVTSIPFLLPMIGLLLLNKGHVLLHSSAFVQGGKGSLVAGWQKGGKTEMLLAFMSEGAAYLANEWTIVSPEEGLLRGIGGVLQIWDWHLRYTPQYLKRLPEGDRRRLAVFRLYQRIYGALPQRSSPKGVVRKALRQLSLEGGVSLLRQVRVTPERLFGDSMWVGPATLNHVFLATVGDSETKVYPSGSQEIAQRMVASQSYERNDLLAAYDHFRFAFPERRNRLLEQASERELQMLSRAFSGKATHEIVHPYPVPLGHLYRAAAPYCD